MNCRTSDVDPELGILKWPIQGIIEERMSLPERKLLTLLTRDVGRTLLPFFFGFVLVKVTHHLMLKKALALDLMTIFFFSQQQLLAQFSPTLLVMLANCT